MNGWVCVRCCWFLFCFGVCVSNINHLGVNRRKHKTLIDWPFGCWLQVARGGERASHPDAGVQPVPAEEVPPEDDLQRRRDSAEKARRRARDKGQETSGNQLVRLRLSDGPVDSFWSDGERDARLGSSMHVLEGLIFACLCCNNLRGSLVRALPPLMKCGQFWDVVLLVGTVNGTDSQCSPTRGANHSQRADRALHKKSAGTGNENWKM